jgi:hypothetical protein
MDYRQRYLYSQIHISIFAQNLQYSAKLLQEEEEDRERNEEQPQHRIPRWIHTTPMGGHVWITEMMDDHEI